jgi:hypothetical protein
MAAFGLITNALLFSIDVKAQTSQALPITTQITALPFVITSPGTYVLTGDLNFPSVPLPAITIQAGLPGPVVLDLGGFTISGDVTPGGDCIDITAATPVSSPITIQNGTIRSFVVGVNANVGFIGNNLSNVTINKVTFFRNILRPLAYSLPIGVQFQNVNSSTISNCVFRNVVTGIQDINTGGGNRYLNDTFIENLTPLQIVLDEQFRPSLLIKKCEFSAP